MPDAGGKTYPSDPDAFRVWKAGIEQQIADLQANRGTPSLRLADLLDVNMVPPTSSPNTPLTDGDTIAYRRASGNFEPVTAGASLASIMVAADTGQTVVTGATAMAPTWQTFDAGNPDTFNLGGFFTQPNNTHIQVPADCFVLVTIYLRLTGGGTTNYAEVGVQGAQWAPPYFRVPPDSGATDMTPNGSFLARVNAGGVGLHAIAFNDTGSDQAIADGFFGVVLLAKA